MFRYDTYDNGQYVNRIGNLLLRQGDITAHGAEDVGQIRAREAAVHGQVLSNGVRNIGQILTAPIDQIIRHREDAPRREMEALQLQEARAGVADRAAARERQTQQQHDDMAAQIGHEILTGGGTPDAVHTAMSRAVQSGALKPDEAQQFVLMSVEHAEKIPDAAKALLSRSPAGQAFLDKLNAPKPEPKVREIKTRNADGSETIRLVPDTAGSEFNSAAPPKPEPKKYPVTVPGPHGEPVTKLVTEDEMNVGVQTYRAPQRPITVNTGDAGNVKETIAGMKDGTLPPLMPGRASKDYTALLAEAHRQGYDLAGAATDWAATQKHVATMNGAQQLRLNQAINSLPDMLDSVDALASKWKGGRFPALNNANLALAKGGAYGSEAASIANQLDAQIADVTADLGNVYMGGNSPTDHALGLAGKSLKGEWNEKVLHDMVALAKKNVIIRRNSISNTGVSGASAGNPYGSQPAPSAVETIYARDPQGKVHQAQAGTPLPAGWVQVQKQ